MTLTNRIQSRLDALSLKPRAASVRAGLNTHYLQKVLSGETKSISVDALLKLAEALETSPEWLLLGRGPDEMPPGATELLNLYAQLPDLDRKSALDYVRWLLTKGPDEE